MLCRREKTIRAASENERVLCIHLQVFLNLVRTRVAAGQQFPAFDLHLDAGILDFPVTGRVLDRFYNVSPLACCWGDEHLMEVQYGLRRNQASIILLIWRAVLVLKCPFEGEVPQKNVADLTSAFMSFEA